MSERTVGSLGEKALLQRLQRYVSEGKGVVRAFSEDCAVLEDGPGRYRLMTIDVMVDGEHFRSEWTPPFFLGRKAVNVNVSDISAMGGKALRFLVSLGLPPSTPLTVVEEMYRGIESAARQSDLVLAGGNVSASHVFFVDILMEGEVPAGEVLLRNGARPGDVLYVTGGLGAASAGLRFLEEGYRLNPSNRAVAPDGSPVEHQGTSDAILAHLDPPVLQQQARWLAASGFATSMMDLSDGLASDMPEICRESRVGALVEAAQIPVDSAARNRSAAEGLQLALSGGEDYHLLFTVKSELRDQFERSASSASVQAHAIGRIVPHSEGILVRDFSGGVHPLGPGFQHFGTK